MVGVAGKSRGCTTCRRRKIRCNQERPRCSNCTKTGRPCEGYERYPVFINRTVHGIRRRGPLEEAKPGVDLRPNAVTAIYTGIGNGLNTNPPFSGARLVLCPSTHAIWATAFLGWFWEDYAPIDGTLYRTMRRPLWLFNAMNLPNPSVALSQSLLALAVVRQGRSSGNETTLNEGRCMYGRALLVLQSDLCDKQRACHEETLAAARAMALYEVSPIISSCVCLKGFSDCSKLYEATSNTATSWQSHISGLANLIMSGGPWSYGTPLARALYEEFQYPLVCRFPCGRCLPKLMPYR